MKTKIAAVMIALIFASVLFAGGGKPNKPNVQAELNKGINLFNNNDLENAIAAFNKVIKVDAKNATAFYYLGMCFEKQGNNDGAIQKYNKAIALKSDYLQALLAKGKLHVKLLQYEPSLAPLNKIVQIFTEKEMSPNELLADAHYNLAMSYSYLKNYDNAITNFKKTLAISPQKAYAHYYLGMAYYNKNQKDLTIEHLNIFLQLAPDAPESPQVRNLLSQIAG